MITYAVVPNSVLRHPSLSDGAGGLYGPPAAPGA